MSSARKKILWLVPEEKGGIRDYADVLWPEIESQCAEAGWSVGRVDTSPLDRADKILKAARRIREQAPDLIHVQHEFGLFGSKLPPLYHFPALVAELRSVAPIVATGHTVLGADYTLPWRNRGWKSLPRFLLNHTLVPYARSTWLAGTWGGLAGAIVHSRLQGATVEAAGCPRVTVIPHFVPSRPKLLPPDGGDVVVFGFFSPEKGQDIAIRAWKQLNLPGRRLLLAGGVRRESDRSYFEMCRNLIREGGLTNVEITGYVPAAELEKQFQSAALVLAPFRETSGSGTLAQAFARGLPILASDLPLNRELSERTPGSLEFFRTEDPSDCARQLESLLLDAGKRIALAKGAADYAASHSLQVTARRHVGFYQGLLGAAP